MNEMRTYYIKDHYCVLLRDEAVRLVFDWKYFQLEELEILLIKHKLVIIIYLIFELL